MEDFSRKQKSHIDQCISDIVEMLPELHKMAWNWSCTRMWVSLQASSDLMLIWCKCVLFSLKKCGKEVTYLSWRLIKQRAVWWPHRGKTLHHLDFCLSRNFFGDFHGIWRLATRDLSLLKSALVSDIGWSLLRKTRGKMIPLRETRKVSGGSLSTPACCVTEGWTSGSLLCLWWVFHCGSWWWLQPQWPGVSLPGPVPGTL